MEVTDNFGERVFVNTFQCARSLGAYGYTTHWHINEILAAMAADI